MSTYCFQLCWASAHVQRCVRVGTKHELQLEASWATAHAMCMTRTCTHTSRVYNPHTSSCSLCTLLHVFLWCACGSAVLCSCYCSGSQRALALTSRSKSMNHCIIVLVCNRRCVTALPVRNESMLGCARARACSFDVDSIDGLSTHKRACTCIVPGVYTTEADATHRHYLPCCETRSHRPRLRLNGTTN